MTFKTIFFLLLLSIVAFSCAKSDEAVKESHAIDFQTVLAEYNANKIPEHFGELKTGTINFYYTSDNLVMQVVGEEFAYLLQKNFQNAPTALPATLNGNLLFLHDRILITNNDKTVLIDFALGNQNGLNSLAELKPNTSLTGDGIIRSNQLDFSEVVSVANDRTASPPRQSDDWDEPVSCSCTTCAFGCSCDSGGSGAESCSISSGGEGCSVTCTNTTACCNG